MKDARRTGKRRNGAPPLPIAKEEWTGPLFFLDPTIGFLSSSSSFSLFPNPPFFSLELVWITILKAGRGHFVRSLTTSMHTIFGCNDCSTPCANCPTMNRLRPFALVCVSKLLNDHPHPFFFPRLPHYDSLLFSSIPFPVTKGVLGWGFFGFRGHYSFPSFPRLSVLLVVHILPQSHLVTL